MALLECKELTFTYAGSSTAVLKDIHLSVRRGELLLITGSSGSGKTTLLKHMKKSMIPFGERKGDVYYRETPVAQLEDSMSAAETGYVGQDPGAQLVTEKVWHELAFGLENLGMAPGDIRKRVAETAAYFGITEWYHKPVESLSGGQKQLLNLAAVMVMRPSLLILDEPTAQLDPIAAGHFIDTIVRLNREVGTTVIMTEHRTEQLFALADRVAVLRQGALFCDAPPREAAVRLAYAQTDLQGLPAALRIFAGVVTQQTGAAAWAPEAPERFPLTVREGRCWLEAETPGGSAPVSEKPAAASSKSGTGADRVPAILLKNVSFRYEKKEQNLLEALELTVYRGEWMALLGANGAGKTTLLRLVAGICKCLGGKVSCSGRVVMVPQNPMAVLTEISVEEELAEVVADPANKWAAAQSREQKRRIVDGLLEQMGLAGLGKINPYDLSGGQQQKLALAKALLLKPDILLLDEPTKGLDPSFKAELGKLLTGLCRDENLTLLMVSHDVEFCARFADRCALLFDRTIISQDTADRFFAGNSYYTTAANRIAGGLYPACVTCEQVVDSILKDWRRKGKVR